MKYQYVNYLWDDAVASKFDAVERLVYRSNILGSDHRITNTGGGNTSAKISEPDPLTGEKVEVLWVKGSGGDLRTSKRENFSSLYQQKLIDMQRLYATNRRKAPKRPRKTKWSGCTPTRPLISIREPVRSIRRCTRSFHLSMSITCTRTRLSRSPRPGIRSSLT